MSRPYSNQRIEKVIYIYDYDSNKSRGLLESSGIVVEHESKYSHSHLSKASYSNSKRLKREDSRADQN